MFYECLSDKSLIVVYHVDGENEARVSCIFCQWFMDVYGKLQCLSMVNREARVSCNAPWLLGLCSRSSTDTRGRDWASSCRTSWIRTSSILPKKMSIFQFETSPTNYKRVGKSWQVQQNDARDIQWSCRRVMPFGPKTWACSLTWHWNSHRSYRVISMLINILIYTWYHMIFQNFLTTGWDFSLPCLVMFNYWRCFYYIKIPGIPGIVWWWSWRGFPI